MAEEPRLFLRSALFGILMAAIYWLVSGDIAGTVLLGAFGLSAMFLAAILFGRWRAAGGELDTRPQRLLGLETLDESSRIIPEVTRFPSPGLAPLLAGIGVSLAALSLPWGPGFFVAALPFLLLAAWSWYRAAFWEFPGWARRAEESEASAVPADARPEAPTTTPAAPLQPTESKPDPTESTPDPTESTPDPTESKLSGGAVGRSALWFALATVVVIGVIVAPRGD